MLSFSEILSRQASRSILRDSFANLYGSVARLVFCLALTAFGLLGSAVENVTGIEVIGKIVGVGEEDGVVDVAVPGFCGTTFPGEVLLGFGGHGVH